MLQYCRFKRSFQYEKLRCGKETYTKITESRSREEVNRNWRLYYMNILFCRFVCSGTFQTEFTLGSSNGKNIQYIQDGGHLVVYSHARKH